MRQYVGGGWHIHSLTDRTIHLRKADPAYWRLTGDDGFVHVRIGPEQTRADLIEQALKKANETDDEMTRRITQQLIPETRNVAAYRKQIQRMTGAFGTPEDEAVIGRKRV